MKNVRLSYVLLLINCLLVISFYATATFQSYSLNQDFTLTVIGYTGEKSLGGAPTPPGYNETSLGTITWSATWYCNPVFQLVFQGKDPVKVTSIQIWQETRWQDIIWNVTGPIEVPPPSKTIFSGGIFQFQVNESFIGDGWGLDTISAAIQPENQDLMTLSITHNYPSYLSSWNSQTTLYYSTSLMISILIPCLGALGLFAYRRRTRTRT